MSPDERPGFPVTDTQGNVHTTVCYPFAHTVGCSCGWVRRNVDPSIMDELCEIHLADNGIVPPW